MEYHLYPDPAIVSAELAIRRSQEELDILRKEVKNLRRALGIFIVWTSQPETAPITIERAKRLVEMMDGGD